MSDRYRSYPHFPRALHLALVWLASLLLLGLFHRLALWAAFSATAPLNLVHAASALWLGLRFDLRMALLVLSPLWVMGLSPRLSPFTPSRARWLKLYAAVCFAALALVWILDAGYFSYLSQRLDAGIFPLMSDATEAVGMVSASYPVLWISLAWVLSVALGVAAIGWSWRYVERASAWEITPRAYYLSLVVMVLLWVLGVHGRLSQYPLRWSDTAAIAHPFASALALNPVLNVADTLAFANNPHSLAKLKPHLPLLARYLDVPPEQLLAAKPQWRRDITAAADTKQLNLVVVYLESFASHKTSLTGNKLNPTPFVAELARQSLLFDQFFTPSVGTARSVYTGITGLADVMLTSTATRNPKATAHHTVWGSLAGYRKLYFIGGSTSWANVRALLLSSVPGVDIVEEGQFADYPRNDVWGISDHNLFKVAVERLNRTQQPFSAVIQTAGNHRPFTIAKEDTAFVVEALSDASAQQHGFVSAAEYNAVRYLDWNVQQFMQMARQQSWFKDTVFVFFGDHGIGGYAGEHRPEVFTRLGLNAHHVPLLIHAPAHITPRVNHTVASQVDVFPTVAKLIHAPHSNSTLGRDLLDGRFANERYAFTISHGDQRLGLIGQGYYYLDSGPSKGIHALDATVPPASSAQQEHMRALTQALYQAFGYLATHHQTKQ